MVDRSVTQTFFEKLGITDVPDRFHLLDQTPAARESYLDSGQWIILVVAVWSAQDRMIIPRAAKSALDFKGVNFGVRFFDDHGELRAWCPDAKAAAVDVYATPLWIALQDGRVVSERVGLLTDDSMTRWFVEAFNPAAASQHRDKRSIIGHLRALFRLD